MQSTHSGAVNEGTSITMTCQDQSLLPSPQLTWINSEQMELAKGAVYTINEATSLSTGSYMCKSQQGSELVYSNTITLNVTCKSN